MINTISTSKELAPEPRKYISRIFFSIFAPMDNIRLNKVSRLIQKELADIFLIQAKKISGNAMITVTEVRVTKDLSYARVFLSLFGIQNKNEFLSSLKDNVKEIRRALGNRLKHQLRIIPELDFILDDSLDYIDHIDELLKH
jgi:ribosome-binding factor A